MATTQSHKERTCTHRDNTHTHNLEVALLKLRLLRSYLLYVLSPRVSGYPRVQFSSLRFPPGCLRLTGPRNKTSTRNFVLTSPIFARQMKKNGRHVKDRRSLSVPVSLCQTERREWRGERRRDGGVGGLWTGVHLNIMTDRHKHSRTHRQLMNTHTHTHQRCCLGKGYVNKI